MNENKNYFILFILDPFLQKDQCDIYPNYIINGFTGLVENESSTGLRGNLLINSCAEEKATVMSKVSFQTNRFCKLDVRIISPQGLSLCFVLPKQYNQKEIFKFDFESGTVLSLIHI